MLKTTISLIKNQSRWEEHFTIQPDKYHWPEVHLPAFFLPKMRDLLFQILSSFYNKATTDVMIGYHFTKFQDPEVLNHHLVRITSFWELQLTGETTVPLERGFQLLYTHLQLNLRRGELGRWVVLFHQTLDEFELKIDHPEMKILSQTWKERIGLFEQRFRSHPKMFS